MLNACVSIWSDSVAVFHAQGLPPHHNHPAVGLAQWHASAAFCHRSGAPMVGCTTFAPHFAAAAFASSAASPIMQVTLRCACPASYTQVATSGGHSRQAVAAPGSSGRRPRAIYPRIDPAVIVAVGYAILGPAGPD